MLLVLCIFCRPYVCMVRLGLTLGVSVWSILFYITCPITRRTTCKNELLIFSSECAQSDLQKDFLKYPGVYLKSFIADDTLPTEEDRFEWCRIVQTCRGAIFSSRSESCGLMDTTVEGARGHTLFYEFTVDYYFYQVTCAWGSGQDSIIGGSCHKCHKTRLLSRQAYFCRDKTREHLKVFIQ